MAVTVGQRAGEPYDPPPLASPRAHVVAEAVGPQAPASRPLLRLRSPADSVVGKPAAPARPARPKGGALGRFDPTAAPAPGAT